MRSPGLVEYKNVDRIGSNIGRGIFSEPLSLRNTHNQLLIILCKKKEWEEEDGFGESIIPVSISKEGGEDEFILSMI